MHLKNQTFLVSGGASGLGAACAAMLVGGDANVIIADVDQDKGQRLAEQLGARARFVRTDVTDDVSVGQTVNVAVQTFGGLHGSIQCAGVGLAEKVLGKTGPNPLESFVKVIQINLVGTYNVIRHAVAAMVQNTPSASGERGVIVNTSSISAFEGQIGQAAYAASKGGVAALTVPLAREFARHGIRVLAIAPGIFDTPLLAGLPEAARKSLGEQVPFPPRLGRPEEFAALVRQTIENEMLNGAVLRLDGALRMAPR